MLSKYRRKVSHVPYSQKPENLQRDKIYALLTSKAVLCLGVVHVTCFLINRKVINWN